MLTPASTIAILGIGDGCRRMATALAPRGCALRVFEPRLPAMQVEALGVDVAASLEEALRGARLVVLDDDAARAQVVQALQPGQTLLDLHPDADSSWAGSARYMAGRFKADDAAAGGARLWITGAGAGQLAAALNTMGLAATATATLPVAQLAGSAPAAKGAMGGATPPVVLRGELP